LTVGRNLWLDNTKITTIPTSAKISGKIFGLKQENIMKKEELKQIIKEQISMMGYVDLIPMGNYTNQNKKNVVKEETEKDYFTKIQVQVDEKLDRVLTFISDEIDKIEDEKIAKETEKKIFNHIKQYLF